MKERDILWAQMRARAGFTSPVHRAQIRALAIFCVGIGLWTWSIGWVGSGIAGLFIVRLIAQTENRAKRILLTEGLGLSPGIHGW